LGKVEMALARSDSAVVLRTNPAVLKAIATRQQAAAQLAASGAVAVLDAAAGKATVRGSKTAVYDVTVSATELTCTCADANNGNGNVCKHLRATIAVLNVAKQYVLGSFGLDETHAVLYNGDVDIP
jgi:hypothetical protein